MFLKNMKILWLPDTNRDSRLSRIHFVIISGQYSLLFLLLLLRVFVDYFSNCYNSQSVMYLVTICGLVRHILQW